MRAHHYFRGFKGYLQNRVNDEDIPLNISISVTNRCNLNCDYCNIPERDQDEMGTEEIKSIIDDVEELGGVRLGFWGGEPLLRDDIGELISYSRDNGLFTTLITNGLLVEEKIEAIKDLDVLFISLDGPPEVHNSNRGESHSRAMDAIDTALENDIKVVTITTVSESDEEVVDYIVDKAQEKGFYSTFELLFYEWLPREYDSEEIDYEPLLDHLMEKKRKTDRVANSKSYFRHLKNWDDYTKTAEYPQEEEVLECHAGNFYANIDTGGMLYPCEFMRDKIGGQDVKEKGFREAWKDLDSEKTCGGCMRSGYTEYNQMFSLRLDAIWNAISKM